MNVTGIDTTNDIQWCMLSSFALPACCRA